MQPSLVHCHRSFNIINRFWNHLREDFMTGARYQYIIFNPDANAAKSGWRFHAIFSDIEPGFYGGDHARFKYPPGTPNLVFTHIMNIKTKPMACLVHIVLFVTFLLDQFIQVAIENTQLKQSGSNPDHCSFMRLVPQISRLDLFNRC